MNKIRKEFEKYYDDPYFRLESDYPGFEAGYKAANLLPTTKICPDCGGIGKQLVVYGDCTCKHCKGTGIIQIYYTPEEYKTITGEDYPDDGLIWVFINKWKVVVLKSYPYIHDKFYIVQTAQPAPEENYRGEE